MKVLEREERYYRSFLISFCLIIAVTISGIFLGIHMADESLMFESLRANAQSYFETIVATRAWNANYGGVYVEKKAGVQSNPFIEKPDIETKDGRVFTIRNPAMMTREVSDYIGKDKNFSFRITSKKLVNPKNAPDKFEMDALESFEAGKKELFKPERINGKMYFRYAGPIYVKEECLQCHAKQGYKVGDVRGGISVLFNIDEVYTRLHRNTLLVALFAAVTLSLLVAIFWYLARRLMRKMLEIRRQLEEMANTDVLTGIFNRRHAMKRFQEELERAKRLNKELSCIMLDIDNFKAINDRYGHLAGDEVLKELVNRITHAIRKYDVFGRYGGEEFLVIMPDATIEEAKSLAERIGNEISARPIQDIAVTVSLGVTHYRSSDRVIDDIIKRADDSLYEAKSAGRNCMRFCQA
jgi:diguanylate cyclase (GGDEF)-like protein